MPGLTLQKSMFLLMAAGLIAGCAQMEVSTRPNHPGQAVDGAVADLRGKLSPYLKHTDHRAWLGKSGLVRVLFRPGVMLRDALKQISTVPGARPVGLRPETFPTLQAVRIAVPDASLPRLASLPSVHWVEPVMRHSEDDSTLVQHRVSDIRDLAPGRGLQYPLGPYNLTGLGIVVGHWESAALPLPTHLDLQGRVVLEETPDPDAVPGEDILFIGDHATGVLGVIGGAGRVIPAARGVAPSVRMTGWVSQNGSDPEEIGAAALSSGGAGEPVRIHIANVTAGRGGGWNSAGTRHRPEQFGRYTGLTALYDRKVRETGIPVIKSAGNRRLRKWNGQPPQDAASRPGPSCGSSNPPFVLPRVFRNCIGPVGAAKNVITVGAVNEVSQLAPYSSVGPTLDGRLKPDVVALGDITLPPLSSRRRILMLAARDGDGEIDARATQRTGGTSFATPVVSGIAALLMEQAARQGFRLNAAMIKAMLVHTARDVVDPVRQAYPGPDYATGWGVVQARPAVDLLKNSSGLLVQQRELRPIARVIGYRDSFRVPAGAAGLKVTMAWTDPSADPAEDSARPRLVNDLDLRLTSPDGRVFRPWVLDPTDPTSPAQINGGDDDRNNVEQVQIERPRAGIWRLSVTAKRLAGSQPFVLVSDTPLRGVE